MTTGGEVVVEVAGRDVNLVALLAKVEAQMRQTDQQGIRLAQTTAGTYTAAQQRAANATLAEAQALARAAIAAGEDARAHQILVNALGQSAGASDRAVAGVTAQIARLQSGRTAATEFGDAMKSGLLGIVGPAALATGAIGAVTTVVKSFADAFKFKADLDATTASIRAQLTGVRDSNQVFSEGAQFAAKYKLTQQETTAAIAASIGVMRNSKAGVEDILSVLARLQILSPEQSLQEAAVAVKALASGDTTSLVTRFEVGRDVAGQMREQIQGGADAVEVLNKFLNDTGIGMDALAAKTTGATGKMKDLARAQEELKLAQANFAQGPGLAILNEQVTLVRGATRGLSGDFSAISDRFRNTADSGTLLGGMLRGVAIGFDAMTVSAMSAADREQLHASVMAQNAAASAQAGQAALVVAQADLVHADAAAAASQALREHGAATAALGLQSQLTASAIAQATQAETEHALTMEQDAAKAQLAGVESQTLAIRKQLLTQQALAAANALIASGNAGAAAAGRLAASSSLVDQLTAAYLRLHAAQGQALQATTAQIAATRITRDESNAVEVLANKRSVAADQRRREAADYEKAQAAARRYQQEIGNFSPSIERAERELALLPQGTEAYYNKSIEVQKLKQQQASAIRKGGRGGATEQLSDGQKLHNSLLADQEKYQDQAEAAEQQHQQRLLDIDRDYQKKSLEQQKKNETDKRRSELDYLKSITSSELNATKEGRAEIQRINERYYADFAAAQAAAQAGNVKQSEEMVEQARKRAQMEQQYAEEIEKARKDKNTSEIERLTALRERERQLLDEQDKQIREGGDEIVNARNEAMDQEERRYKEQQGKIKEASNDATERKINNALRSGKSIDEENVKLKEQEQILNRIGNRGASGSAAPGQPVVASAAPGVSSESVASAPAAIDFSAVVAAINALQPLLGEVKTAIETDTRLTTTAIRVAGSQRVMT